MPLTPQFVPDDENDNPNVAWPSRKAAAAARQPKPPPSLQPRAGIVVKTLRQVAGGATQKVFINCVQHEAIEQPMMNSNVVEESYIEERGLENLRVPLLVGAPRKTKEHSGADAMVLDVIFSDMVIKRALKDDSEGGISSKYYKQRIAELAVKFAAEETMWRLNPQWKLLANTKYKAAEGEPANKPAPFILPMEAMPDEPEPTPEPPPEKSRSGITEVEPTKSKKKKKASKMSTGFFSGDTKSILYPKGSTEGVLPEGAGDPLGFIPKSLRDKLNVINTGGMKQGEVDKEIRNYAETGGKQPAAGDKYPPAVQKVLEDTAVQQLLMQMKSAPDEAQATIQQMMSTPASQKKLDVLMKHGIITTAPDPSADKASAAAKPYSANAYAAKAAENKLGAAKAPKSTQPAAAEQMKQAGMEQMMQAMLGGGDSGMEQMMGALGGMEGMDGSGDMAADMAALEEMVGSSGVDTKVGGMDALQQMEALTKMLNPSSDMFNAPPPAKPPPARQATAAASEAVAPSTNAPSGGADSDTASRTARARSDADSAALCATASFKSGRDEEAVGLWAKAIARLSGAEAGGGAAGDVAALRLQQAKWHNNCAMAWLRCERFEEACASADGALALLDASSEAHASLATKATWRRASSHLGLRRWRLAVADLETVRARTSAGAARSKVDAQLAEARQALAKAQDDDLGDLGEGEDATEAKARGGEHDAAATATAGDLPAPEHSVAVEEGKVTVRVSMPGVASMAEVALDMSATELSVEVPGVYSLRVSLPCAVDVEAVRAKFRKKAQQLQVSVPCLA